MELDRNSQELLLALDAAANERGEVDLREFVPPGDWQPAIFRSRLMSWQEQKLVLLPSQKTLVLPTEARNLAREIRERRRKDPAPELSDSDYLLLDYYKESPKEPFARYGHGFADEDIARMSEPLFASGYLKPVGDEGEEAILTDKGREYAQQLERRLGEPPMERTRRGIAAPVSEELPDKDPEHFGPMPPVTLDGLSQTARGLLLTMRSFGERTMDDLRAAVGRPLPEVIENLQVLLDRKAARRAFGEDFKVKLTVFGQALANLAQQQVMDERYKGDSPTEPTQATPKEELSKAEMELRLLRAMDEASTDGEAVVVIPLAEKCGIPPEKRVLISHALINKRFIDPETMESARITEEGRQFLARMNSPLPEDDILNEASRRFLSGESRERVLQQISEVAKPIASVPGDEITKYLAEQEAQTPTNQPSPKVVKQAKTENKHRRLRVVPKEAFEHLHSLLIKVQSNDTRLSACLAEGVAVASKIGDAELRDFCSRELTAYFAKEGETTWPDWRQLNTYKIPGDIVPNSQTFHRTEEGLLAEIGATFGVPLSPDYWVPSVGDTEEQLASIEKEIAENRALRICVRKLPASLYSNDPKYKNLKVTVITPTSQIRRVIDATRREFTERLLQVGSNLKARSSSAGIPAWLATIIDFLKEPWKAVVTAAATLAVLAAVYYIKHQLGIDLQPPKP